ncbi:hypothetical protein PUR59_35415 [Streptomyces sp. SP18ES09]|uniref:hypothetical protein n=1 Tax=Streptomyces sp. SP18ES09 TaxID=3002532 RepID=UPI002E785E72|nr:hypothetical protein [Streptomyces sp. SP18ES09]MEE1820289.1 hypothetical protein [Streptomyces sp. SP18ES09]
MTFILMTCGPMLAALLLVHRRPRAPRHGRSAQPPRPAPRRTLIHCRFALSLECSAA